LAGITIIVGAALILVGIVGFAGTGAKTSLIPAYVGIVLALLGVWARNPGSRKAAMHIAVTVGLLGFLMAAGRLGMSLARGTTPKPAALASLSLMALLCLVFVILCVRSFIAARRARTLGAESTPSVT